MSALGQKQTFALQWAMSALHPKADVCGAARDVRPGRPWSDYAAHGFYRGRLRFAGNVLLSRRLIRWLRGIPWPFRRMGSATVDAKIDHYCFTVSAR
jgi:hypothetical protein